MLYIALAVLVLVVLIIARAQLNLWSVQPVVHTHLTLDQLAPLIRSWGAWLDERGRIVVRHAETNAEVELRKRRYSTKPDLLVFRVRNADATKEHFEAIRVGLDTERVAYELVTTPKRGQPRAIEVALGAEDIHMPAAAQRLIQQVFRSTTGFQIHCEGRMRAVPNAPTVPLLPWRQDAAAGYHLGQKLGRLTKRFFG